MTSEDTYQKLKAIITPYLPDDITPDSIKKESRLLDELNINSANLVDIVLDVEDAFDITLENAEMDDMKTVSDALKIIEAKLK